jgi:hypothetical protein
MLWDDGILVCINITHILCKISVCILVDACK